MLFPKPNIIENHTEESKRKRLAICNALNSRLQSVPIDYKNISSVACQGESKGSVVYVVKYKDNTHRVLKFVEDKDDMVIEDYVLSKWREIGIRVPEVYNSGNIQIDEFTASYIELEYISGENLLRLVRNGSENVEEYRYRILSILKKIHSIRVEGFGRILNDGKFSGEFNSLEEYLRFKYPEEIFENAFKGENKKMYDYLLNTIVDTDINITIEHGDFREGNFIINNKELALIDPNPSYNHPYFDVAYYIILNVMEDENFSAQEIYDIYDIENEKAMKTALILLGSVMLSTLEGTRKEKLMDFLADQFPYRTV